MVVEDEPSLDLETEWLRHMHRAENRRTQRFRRSIIPSISIDDQPQPQPPLTVDVDAWPREEKKSELRPPVWVIRLVWTAVLLWVFVALAMLSWSIAWVVMDYLR